MKDKLWLYIFIVISIIISIAFIDSIYFLSFKKETQVNIIDVTNLKSGNAKVLIEYVNGEKKFIVRKIYKKSKLDRIRNNKVVYYLPNRKNEIYFKELFRPFIVETVLLFINLILFVLGIFLSIRRIKSGSG